MSWPARRIKSTVSDGFGAKGMRECPPAAGLALSVLLCQSLVLYVSLLASHIRLLAARVSRPLLVVPDLQLVSRSAGVFCVVSLNKCVVSANKCVILTSRAHLPREDLLIRDPGTNGPAAEPLEFQGFSKPRSGLGRVDFAFFTGEVRT